MSKLVVIVMLYNLNAADFKKLRGFRKKIARL